VTSVLAAYAFEPIQRRVLVNDDVSTFEGKQLQTCLPVVSVRRHIKLLPALSFTPRLASFRVSS